jgi:penicillin amidase
MMDDLEIPHVRADSLEAAMACVGYQHGLDRAWQMELFRLTYKGRSAEWQGYKGVRSDVFMRLLDFENRARRIAGELKPKNLRLLEAYALGASRGMKESWNKVPEFQTEYFPRPSQPEPWKPEDSIGVFLLQSLSQTQRSFTNDLEEETWKKEQGEGAQALFSDSGLPWENWIMPVPAVESDHAEAEQDARLPDGVVKNELLEWAEHRGFEGTGSNNWVVAPSRSASGKAWLLNDPHLDLKTPPFWYWIHFQAPGAESMGASLPGTPVIASGLNQKVAWGLTNAYMDTADVVEVPKEKVSELEEIRPTIWVRWWKINFPIFWKTFQRTAQGLPVLPIDTGRDSVYVVRWSGLHLKGKHLDPLFDVAGVKSAAELDQLLSEVGLPSWNYVFADVDGNVGYRTMGLIPRRTRKTDFGVQTWKEGESLDFDSFLSPQEQPHAFNPERGWLATANNSQWPANRGPGGLYDGRSHYLSMRGYRIAELLEKEPKHTQGTLQAIQCDVQAVDARFIAPLLVEKMEAVEDLRVQAVMGLLSSWDYQADRKCVACGIYRRWMNHAIDGQGIDERAFWRGLQMKEDSAPEWAKVAQLKEVLQEALNDLGLRTPDEIRNPQQRWENWIRIAFDHLSGIESFSPTALTGIGDAHTVNPGIADWGEREGKSAFWQRAGASQRVVVELTRPPTVHAMLAGSNRRVGPGVVSADARQPWSRWAGCEYAKWNFPMDWSSSRSLAESIQF